MLTAIVRFSKLEMPPLLAGAALAAKSKLQHKDEQSNKHSVQPTCCDTEQYFLAPNQSANGSDQRLVPPRNRYVRSSNGRQHDCFAPTPKVTRVSTSLAERYPLP